MGRHAPAAGTATPAHSFFHKDGAARHTPSTLSASCHLHAPGGTARTATSRDEGDCDTLTLSPSLSLSLRRGHR